MADLTTLEAVKRQLGLITNVNGTMVDNTDDDDIISTYITEASQLFETETRYSFFATGGATLTYNLTPPDIYGRKLFFGKPILAIDRVLNGDGSEITASDYTLLPNNDSPKYALQLTTYSNVFWQVSPTTGYAQAITINGTTGYCDTGDQPSDVTLAATKLAAHLYLTRDNMGQIQVAEGFVSIPSDTPKLVLRIINNYKRARLYP